jgi:NADPH:quinone reductase-like Zn-dependent oxidoreductase/aryl carrier-like protein/phage tail protein X
MSAAVVRDAAAPPAPVRTLGDGAAAHDVAAHYARLTVQGAHYGPSFRAIRHIERAGDALLADVALPADVRDAGAMLVHPALLDACLQAVGAAMVGEGVCAPVAVDRFRVWRSGASAARCHIVVESTAPDAPSVRADLTLFDDAGAAIAEVRGLVFQRVTRAALDRRAAAPQRPDWRFEVQWQAAPHAAEVPNGLAGRWHVLADGTPPADDLAAELARRGAAATVAMPDGPIPAGPWRGVVALLGTGRHGDTLDALKAAHAAHIDALLAALPALAESGAPLWLVTRGAQAVAGSLPDLAAAPAWGLGGVVANEHPALRAVRVDLDPARPAGEAALLAAALGAADGEDRVAFRGGARYVARLTPGTLLTPEAEPPRRLEIAERGVLENLALVPVERRAPGPGEVEIRVAATGLNFRDVLNALGMYPGDPGPLGNECAGVVSAVGEDVTDFAVGDEVVSMIDASFATYVVAPAELTVRKPANLSFVEAATIPVTFLTVEYALAHLARVRPGERVLVHAATGGVGMAALQLARRMGAEIFATAGTPAKRELALALGAHHVSDSRSLAFVDDVRRDSRGEGVDVVLNSLAGEFIPGSLDLLRAGGRFVEIGKTGIWDEAAVAKSFPGVAYHTLYLGEVTRARPRLVRDMLQRLMDDFATGALTPLPQTVFPIERAEDAFRYMGQGRHTGKIVITQRPAPPEVRPDATYLVTGGLGGLGLAFARSLADQGARHLVLVGRHAPNDAARHAVAELEARGVSVTVAAADVSAAADVGALLARIAQSMPPLRGVLHAAGVVDDATLAELSPERFARVMAPKVDGAWHLHTLTAGVPLDFFVMFSSGAALLGSPGQGNYAAANSFMDALAFVRHAQGRPALSVNWGSWADVGMAAGVSEQHRRRWAEQGLRMIRPAEGVRMLRDTLRGGTAPNVAVLPLDRARLTAGASPFFRRVVAAEGAARPRDAGAADPLARVAAAAPDERPALVADFLADQIVRVLAMDRSARLRRDLSLMEMGLDSLMAMELRNRVQSALKVRVAVADLLAGPTLDQLTALILGAMRDALAPAAAPHVPDVDEMTDAEVDAALAALLGSKVA